MANKDYQGKSKINHDSAELMAFVGVVGASVSMIAYFIFILLLASCQAPEKVEPIRTPSVVRSFTVQVQPNGVTIFPKYVPFLKGK